MGKLQFLSGFTLGQLLAKAIVKNTNPKLLFGESYERHNSSWVLFNTNQEFLSGLKIGIDMKELPTIESSLDLESWFNSFLVKMIQ